jgi:hypothetical protein
MATVVSTEVGTGVNTGSEVNKEETVDAPTEGAEYRFSKALKVSTASWRWVV